MRGVEPLLGRAQFGPENAVLAGDLADRVAPQQQALAVPALTGLATVTALDDPYRLVVSGLSSFAEGWFGFGRAQWSSGRRSGLRDGVVSHARVGGADILGFATRIGDWVAVGDTLSVTAGCDRRFATCRDRFANAVNFRGFPHIPGSDYVLRHPRNGDAMDGRAVVK